MAEDLQPLGSEEDINQEWLEKMLSLKFGSSVDVNFWTKTLPAGRQGFLSEIAFVKVIYTVEGEESEVQLVFKFLPQDASLRGFMSKGRLAEREVEFYRFTSTPEFQEICHKLGITLPVPETFYARLGKEAITIVLRDLTMDDYKSVIVRDGSSLSQTKAALEAVALIHAAGVVYLQKHEDKDGLGALNVHFSEDFYEQFFPDNLRTLSERYKGSSLAKTFKDLIPLTVQIASTCRRNPLLNTFIHGDLWAGQLLYSGDESSVSVIDWQFCHLDNPVSDIMSMLFMSSDPRILEEDLDEVLESYWSTFSKTVKAGGGTVDISFEELMANMEEMWMCGFTFLASSIHDFLSADNISESRLHGYLSFLEKKGVFKRFLAKFGNQEKI